MTPTLALLALLALQCPGGNCPGGVCLPPGHLPMPQPSQVFHWEWHDEWQQHILRDGTGRQIGAYCPRRKLYQERDQSEPPRWRAALPPISPPKEFRPANDQKAGATPPICGVVSERVAPSDGKVLVTSNVPQFQALNLDQAKDLVAAGIPDFSKDRRIVFVGSPDQCNKIKQQLGAVDGAQVQCYPPDAWELADLQTGKPLFEVRETPAAFVFEPPDADGQATMIAQAHGQQEVNQLVEGLRQRRNDFDQSKVPGPSGNWGGVPINTQTVGIGVSVLLFVLGAVVPRKVHVVGDAL